VLRYLKLSKPKQVRADSGSMQLQIPEKTSHELDFILGKIQWDQIDANHVIIQRDFLFQVFEVYNLV